MEDGNGKAHLQRLASPLTGSAAAVKGLGCPCRRKRTAKPAQRETVSELTPATSAALRFGVFA
jgi:hypothetical protein